jgi:hypothetical protein
MIEPEPSPRLRRWTRRFRIALSAIYLVPIGIGLRLLGSGSLFLGAFLAALGAILFVLSLRRGAYGSDFVEAGPDAGNIAPAYFDYLVVSVVAVPLILVAFLIWSLLVRA